MKQKVMDDMNVILDFIEIKKKDFNPEEVELFKEVTEKLIEAEKLLSKQSE